MGRVIAAENFECAINQSFQDGFAVSSGAEWRVHFAIGVVRRPERSFRIFMFETEDAFAIGLPELFTPRDGRIGEREMVRTGFPGDRHTPLLCFADEPNAPGCAEMLAMDMTACHFGKKDVAGDDHFFASRGPSVQAQSGAPIALVHDTITYQRVILAMIHQRQIKHPGVLKSAAHQFIALHTMSVVRYSDDTRSLKRADRRQLFSSNILRDRAVDEEINHGMF